MSEEQQEKGVRQMYPCDNPDSYCPFNAQGGYDCRNFCGLGVDEDYEDDDEYEDVNDIIED